MLYIFQNIDFGQIWPILADFARQGKCGKEVVTRPQARNPRVRVRACACACAVVLRARASALNDAFDKVTFEGPAAIGKTEHAAPVFVPVLERALVAGPVWVHVPAAPVRLHVIPFAVERAAIGERSLAAVHIPFLEDPIKCRTVSPRHDALPMKLATRVHANVRAAIHAAALVRAEAVWDTILPIARVPVEAAVGIALAVVGAVAVLAVAFNARSDGAERHREEKEHPITFVSRPSL